MTKTVNGCYTLLVFLAGTSAAAALLPAGDWKELSDRGTEAYHRGAYQEAEKFYADALSQATNCGDRDDRVAASLSGLATAYRAEGKYSQSEKLYQRAIELRETNFGRAHPETAVLLNNLGSLYQIQGRYAEAEPLFKKCLATWEQAPGDNRRHIATSLNNLAGIYRTRAHYAEAEPLYRRALALNEASEGREHPSVALVFFAANCIWIKPNRFISALWPSAKKP